MQDFGFFLSINAAINSIGKKSSYGSTEIIGKQINKFEVNILFSQVQTNTTIN